MNPQLQERIENFSLRDYTKLFHLIGFLGYKFRIALGMVVGGVINPKDVREIKKTLIEKILPKLGINTMRKAFGKVFQD